MLLSKRLTGRSAMPRWRFRTGSHCCVLIAAWFAFGSACAAVDPGSRFTTGGSWDGFAIGVILAILIAIFSRTRVKAAEGELTRLKEFAGHCEYERNLAQQELVKRLEEERELAKEKMQFESQLSDYEKFASLAQLALGAAHEINNPLLGILSHLELERRGADDEQREEIDQCIEGAKRISMAVRGLLDYARPGPLTLSKVNLRRLAEETLNFVGHQPMFRQIELQNCIPADLPSITADSNQLSQILMNLLLNAAQATTPGGRITVLADKVKFAESIELRVRDTGSGIPADICRTSLSHSSPPSAGGEPGSVLASPRATFTATGARSRWKAFPVTALPCASRCRCARRASWCSIPRR